MGREYPVNSDALLWKDFLQGDPEAFRLIYKNYVQLLYKYGCNFTSDEALVKDCIQEVFLDLHKYRSGLGSTDNIKLYLFKSLKRKIIKSTRKGGLFNSLDSNSVPFYYTNSIEDELVVEEQEQSRYKKLEEALLKLSPRQKEAIYLRFVSNLSYEEISKVLDMNYQSARNLIFRGIEKLRASFPSDIILLTIFV